MWFFSQRAKIFFACFLVVVLEGCVPLLEQRDKGTLHQLSSVAVDNIAEMEGQYMRTRLKRLLDNEINAHHAYRLSVVLSTSKKLLAPSPQGLASRYSLTTTARCTLRNIKQEILLEKSFTIFNSYGVMEESPFSMTAGEKMNTRSNIDRLAEDIFIELAMFFKYHMKEEKASEKKASLKKQSAAQ